MKAANFNKEVKRVAMLEAKLPKSLERLVQRMDELKLDFNLTFSELIEVSWNDISVLMYKHLIVVERHWRV